MNMLFIPMMPVKAQFTVILRILSNAAIDERSMLRMLSNSDSPNAKLQLKRQHWADFFSFIQGVTARYFKYLHCA